MNPTQEQQVILEASDTGEDLIINARAGSGKSTTLKMLSERHSEKSVLYVVFSKNLADEANQKFPSNTEARTLHSVAYRFTGHDLAHKINYNDSGYVNRLRTGREIANALRISPVYSLSTDEQVKPVTIGNMVRFAVNKFEQSAEERITKNLIPYRLMKKVAEKYDASQSELAETVAKYAQKLWEKRIDIHDKAQASHGTYVKVFQLQRKKLDYDCIYVDEFQDVNDCFMDIIANQDHCQRILVGDDKQEIMQFAGANSALQKVQGYKVYPLTQSFRFGEKIAQIASQVFEEPIQISGTGDDSTVGEVDREKPHTIVFRTNAALINYAVEAIAEGQDVDIQVDTRGFCNKIKSARALYDGDDKNVKDVFISIYGDWEVFREDAREEPEYNRIADIIEKNTDGQILRALESHMKNKRSRMDDADCIVLITAHKSKGAEWDNVVLFNDFPEVINKDGEFNKPDSSEENLLYVALTRAQKRVEPNAVVYDLLDNYGHYD